MIILRVIASITVLLFLAWLTSENRKAFSKRYVAGGLILQVLVLIVFVKIPFLVELLSPINYLVSLVQESSLEGARFMFGYLAGGPTPFEVKNASAEFIIAFRVLPMIVVVSALSAILFHLKILPLLIRGIARILSKTFKISSVLAFGASSTIFLGTIEAPLLIKPYLSQLTRSQLFALITCTMSTVSGTVMVLYASVLDSVVPNATLHLLVASLVSVPAAMILAHITIPESEVPATSSTNTKLTVSDSEETFVEALMRGTFEGIQMTINIAGIIVCFFALIFLVNKGLHGAGIEHTLQSIIGILFRPLLFLTGIPWSETSFASELMGTKIVLNEFVAYMDLQKYSGQMSESSKLIMTYNLCGFANIASVGIVIGGLSTILPQRKSEIIQLTLRSLLTGNLVVLMTGTLIGFLI
ncbi:MAG: NupC/NupG family nucleoside CNT transporter [Bdellovibrionales bacterium]